MINISEAVYRGWPSSIRLANSAIELVITTAVGPRIIHFSAVGAANLFCVIEETAGQQGGDEFRLYGGHRLWRAPEDTKETYFPDNQPVNFTPSTTGGRFTAPIEPTTHLQKEIEVALEANNSVVVTHRISNYAPYPQELAAWAITMFRAGGVAVLPLPDPRLHTEYVLPTQCLILWGYTNLADTRWRFNKSSVYLWQDATADAPQKIGLSAGRGWLAYCHPAGTIVKQYLAETDKAYPDFGAIAEAFTDYATLELETLSPIVSLESGETVQHLERWLLLDPVDAAVLEQPAEVVNWIEAQL